jgi:hypothetical protein
MTPSTFLIRDVQDTSQLFELDDRYNQKNLPLSLAHSFILSIV